MVKKIITKTTLCFREIYLLKEQSLHMFFDGIELSRRHDQKKTA